MTSLKKCGFSVPGNILVKDRTDDQTSIFAKSDHVTAAILTKGKRGRSGSLVTIFTKGEIYLISSFTYVSVSKFLLQVVLHVVRLHSDVLFTRAHQSTHFTQGSYLPVTNKPALSFIQCRQRVCYVRIRNGKTSLSHLMHTGFPSLIVLNSCFTCVCVYARDF